jgi:hypothetical protein
MLECQLGVSHAELQFNQVAQKINCFVRQDAQCNTVNDTAGMWTRRGAHCAQGLEQCIHDIKPYSKL